MEEKQQSVESPTNALIDGVERSTSMLDAPLLIDDNADSSDDEEENYDEVMQFSHSQPNQSQLFRKQKRPKSTTNLYYENVFGSTLIRKVNQSNSGLLDETIVEEGATEKDKLITDSFLENVLPGTKSEDQKLETRTRISNYIILPPFLMSSQQFSQIKEPPIKNFLPLKLNSGDDLEGFKGKGPVEKKKTSNQILIMQSNRKKHTACLVVIILIASALIVVLILLATKKI